MQITIHRGIDQIGGCITEIATSSTRILIDLGQNLPDNEGNVNDSLATREAIAKLTDGIDAILYQVPVQRVYHPSLYHKLLP